MIEIERYRDLAERKALGRRIAAVWAPDTWMARTTTPEALAHALTGRTLTAARRRGKLLLLDTEPVDADPLDTSPLNTRPTDTRTETTGTGPAGGVDVLGLRFGMTGRLIVDREAGVDQLLYSTLGDDPKWDRFRLDFADGGSLVLSDPRRLGAIELNPDEDALGPDALALTPARLRRALGRTQAPLKTRLMEQSRVAGVGNLIADEVLWRAGLRPDRSAGGLTDNEVRRLSHHLRTAIFEMTARGGSHTGDLMPARTRDGRCPRDGRPLRRTTVGGRTSYWCPHHQR